MPIYSLNERRVELRGEHHFIAHDAMLAGSIVLENEVSVWFGVVIRADNDQVHIGEASNIQDGSVLHVDPAFPMAHCTPYSTCGILRPTTEVSSWKQSPTSFG